MQSKILSNKFTYLSSLIVIFAVFALLIGTIVHKDNKVKFYEGEMQVYKKLLHIADNEEELRAQRIRSVSHKIRKLQPILEEGNVAWWYAEIITIYCGTDMENILIAILFAESSFDHTKINKYGDYGLGQINYKVWGKFFDISRKELLNPIINIQIAITILQMARTVHGVKNDWYLYYHSKTPALRKIYKIKIEKILGQLEKIK